MERVSPNKSIDSRLPHGFRKAFIKDREIPLEARYLLILLFTYKGKNKNCWPSQGELGRVMNRNTDTVRKYLKILEEAGHLKIIPRGMGRSLLYEPSYWKISAGKADGKPEGGRPTEIPRHEPTETSGHISINSGNKDREGKNLFNQRREELGLISRKTR